jgi:tetratricopeptide (TPR) repeat protein
MLKASSLFSKVNKFGLALLLDGFLIASAISMCLLIAFCLWGPDANEFDQMALSLAKKNDFGISQQLAWQAALAWRYCFFKASSPEIAYALLDLSRYYMQTNHPNKAEPLMSKAIDLLTKGYDLEPVKSGYFLDYFDALCTQTNFFIEQHRYNDALTTLRTEHTLMARKSPMSVNYWALYSKQRMLPEEYISAYSQQRATIATHCSPADLPPAVTSPSGSVHLTNLTEKMQARHMNLSDASRKWFAYGRALGNFKKTLEIAAHFEFQLGQVELAEADLNEIQSLMNSERRVGWTKDTVLFQTAAIYEAEGKYEQAAECYRQVEQMENSAGSGDRVRLKIALRNHSDVCRLSKQNSLADMLDQEASAIH